MMAYDPAKKWVLIHQDKLSDVQDQNGAVNSLKITIPLNGMFVKSWTILLPNVTWVTYGFHYVLSALTGFEVLDAQGQVALATVLTQINHRETKSEATLEREYDIVKCIKAVVNFKEGADLALQTAKPFQLLLDL